MRVLEACGFLINAEKSIGEGARTIEYLGLLINSEELSLSLLPKKINEIVLLCERALKAESVSLRDIAGFLGNFAWTVQAIPFAQAQFRVIQWLYMEHANRLGKDLESKIILSVEARQDLSWWIENLARVNGKAISATTPDLVIYSDASLTGWGAALNGATAMGSWSSEDKVRQINELELLTALWALKSFTARASNIAIQLMLDNRTAVTYVNKSEGTHSENLCAIAAQIARWCEDRLLMVSAVYLLLMFLQTDCHGCVPILAIGCWIQPYSGNYRPYGMHKWVCSRRNGIDSWISLPAGRINRRR